MEDIFGLRIEFLKIGNKEPLPMLHYAFQQINGKLMKNENSFGNYCISITTIIKD